MNKSFTKVVGVSPMALLHLLGIFGGIGLTVWMQLEMVQEWILKPGCVFANAVMCVIVLTAIRNMQIDYRRGMIASLALSLFPLGFNFYALELLAGTTAATSFYAFMVALVFLLIVNFLIMVSGKGRDIDDGRFIDESRFDNRRQRKWQKAEKETQTIF